MKQNERIILRDACIPSAAWGVGRYSGLASAREAGMLTGGYSLSARLSLLQVCFLRSRRLSSLATCTVYPDLWPFSARQLRSP
jgi:hypothetical protein